MAGNGDWQLYGALDFGSWQARNLLLALATMHPPEVEVVPAHPLADLGARAGAAGRRHPGALSGAGARGVRGDVPGAPRGVCMIEFKVCGWFRKKPNATSRNRLAPGFGETPGTLAQACSARVGKPCPPLYADGVSNAAITGASRRLRAEC